MPADADLAREILRKARKANIAARKAVTLLRDSNLDHMHDAWREDFLKMLDDVSMHVEIVRSEAIGWEAGDAS